MILVIKSDQSQECSLIYTYMYMYVVHLIFNENGTLWDWNHFVNDFVQVYPYTCF